MALDAERWDEVRAQVEREARGIASDALAAWVAAAGPRSPESLRPPRGEARSQPTRGAARTVRSALEANLIATAVGVVVAAGMIAGAAHYRAHEDELARARASQPRIAPVAAEPAPSAPTVVVAAEPARAAPPDPAPPAELAVAAVATLTHAARPGPSHPSPKAKRAPRPTRVSPEPSMPEPSTPVPRRWPPSHEPPPEVAARVAGLRAAVEVEPRSPWFRLHLAGELASSGNPVGAVRHLDYLRTLDTPAARRALTRAAQDPELARWTGDRWWSARAAKVRAPRQAR